jgi:phi13 family phage major tail protein
MAKVGLKYISYGLLQPDGTYKDGKVMAKAIKATVTSESNDVKLYADDGVAESDKTFRGGKISINIDDLTNEIYAELLGHTFNDAENSVLNNSNDIAPYIGIGFYGKVIRNNSPKYMAKFLFKMQFAEPTDENDTKGETVAFQTPTIEGDVFMMDNGDWRDQIEVDTEAEAIAWIDQKLGIAATPPAGGGA